MAMTLRGIFSRVRAFRSDIPLDASVMMCVSNALRRAARETRMMQETQTSVALLAGTTSYSPTATTGDLLFVEEARVPNIPTATQTYRGTFAPSTGVVTPAYGDRTVATGTAGTFADGDFLIASAAATTDIDSITDSWSVGDIIYSLNDEWYQIKSSSFVDLLITNPITLSAIGCKDQSNTGKLKYCSTEDGVITFYPPTQYDSAIQVKLSYVPTLEFVDEDIDASIDLPMKAEDAVLYGALEHLYLLPGPEQDKTLAMNYGVKARKHMASLLSFSALGQSGMPFRMPPSFTGED